MLYSPSLLVQSRCGVYYVRIIVPARQRATDTPREFRISSHTKDPRHARVFARYARVLFDTLVMQNSVITSQHIQQLKHAMSTRKPSGPPIPFNAHQDDTGAWRFTDVKPEDIPTIDQFLEVMGKHAGTTLNNVAIENPPSIHEPGKLARSAQKKVAKMVAEYLQYETERESEKEIGVKKVPQIKTRLKPFLEHFSSKQVGSLTPADIEAFRKMLVYYPMNIHRLSSAAGLTFDEVIKRSKNKVLLDSSGKPAERISALTVDGYMQTARNFIEFCKKQYAVNPVLIDAFNIKAGKAKEGTKRRAFNKEELQKIFGSEYYREALYNTAYQYWVPVLGAFTGARVNEIAQLKTEDVLKDNTGYYYINITASEDDEDKQLKNEQSKRIIPVHQKLIELGFVEFVEAQKKKNVSNLFEINKSKADKHGKIPSEWFNQKYLRQYLKITDKSVVFHSFRHLFVTKLAQAIIDNTGLEKETIIKNKIAESIMLRRIVGHASMHDFTSERSGSDIHTDTYTGDFSIASMKRFIDMLEYPGVHFFKYQKIDEGKRRRVMLKKAMPDIEISGNDLAGLL